MRANNQQSNNPGGDLLEMPAMKDKHHSVPIKTIQQRMLEYWPTTTRYDTVLALKSKLEKLNELHTTTVMSVLDDYCKIESASFDKMIARIQHEQYAMLARTAFDPLLEQVRK